MCAWCGKQFATEACLEEHDRGVHEHSSIGCVGCGNWFRTQEIYRNRLLKSMNKRRVEESQCLGRFIKPVKSVKVGQLD